MNGPPYVARLLLEASLPGTERETIPGDLDEEFAFILGRGGMAAARAWYWRQVWGSLAPLLSMAWRRAHAQDGVLLAALAFALPLRLLDLLWAFILSQVPLKMDAVRPPEFLWVSLVLACFAGLLCGTLHRRVSIWVGAFALLCLAAIPAALPLWYWAALPFAGAGSAFCIDRIREKR